MKIVREEKISKESIFFVTEKIDGTVIDNYQIMITSAAIENRGVTKYLIYNSKFEVISDAFSFINKNPKRRALNTRRNYLYGLKYLYAFLEIIDKDLYSLNDDDLHQLGSFLRGFSATGEDYEYNLLTKRSSKSVNIFYYAYKEYFRYLHIDNSPLLQRKGLNGNVPMHRYIAGNHKRDTTPKYINAEEYAKIMDYLYDNNDLITLRNKCIIRIMNESGLRIGEVLGLTFEDIQIRESSGGKYECVLIVRNRLSDREFQQAKTCMKIYDKRNYQGNDYRTRNVGFQEAILFDFDGINTYELICDYMDEAHNYAESKQTKKYETTIADAVDSFKTENKVNRYLFLNSIGGVLIDESWNTELRKIFLATGLELDKKFRKNNLSHRFKHGFAMKLMYDMGQISKSSVKVFTRHKSDLGLDAYNNPTTEDVVKMKNDIVDGMGIVDSFEKEKE